MTDNQEQLKLSADNTPSQDKVDGIFNWLINKHPEAKDLNNKFGREVVMTLIAHMGLKVIRNIAANNCGDLVKCIMLCTSDELLPNGKEACVKFPQDRKNPGKYVLSYEPMTNGLLKTWRRNNPNCYLDHVVWSERQWKAWRKIIKERGRSDLFPGPNDVYECDDDDEAMAIISELPGSPDYKLYCIQLIRTCIKDCGEVSRQSFCYRESELYERASNNPLWQGAKRSTDINEMYIKTAIKLFTKRG